MRRIGFGLIGILSIVLGICAAAQERQAAREMLYAAMGPELCQYTASPADATLTKAGSVTVPFAIQYVWRHPSKPLFYVAWSNGMQGDRHGVSAFRINPTTGALTPHGDAIELRHRPVHLTVDADATHILVAYNNPSGVSVHALSGDGMLGAEVKQPNPLDCGIYAHQVRVDPSNKMAILVTRGNDQRPGAQKTPAP
jgi:6-phosphogluconolactonase (cycloisomerase 2 family)